MKDYLNTEERNQIMVFMAILQMFSGNRGIAGASGKNITEDWSSRNNMTKDEQKSIKMAQTYLKKFCDSVIARMNSQEQKNISKRLIKFDFRLVDDFTLKKVYRDMKDRLVNAVVPREQFGDWCNEIMHIHCKDCTKHFASCDLHDIFEDNFIPESSWGLENCRFAYKLQEGKPDPEKVKKFQQFKEKRKI